MISNNGYNYAIAINYTGKLQGDSNTSSSNNGIRPVITVTTGQLK